MKATFLNACLFAFIIVLPSCVNQNNREKDSGLLDSGSDESPEYAKRFDISLHKDYKTLKVYNPWKGNSDTLTYLLVNSHNLNKLSAEQRKRAIITPVERVICLSTTHLGFLGALEVENSVKGISGAQWSNNPKIKNLLNNGEIREVGMNAAYNYETILDLQADVVFAFGINSSSQTQLNKLRDLGVKVILVAEFMENHPLGKSEWLKFFAAFYERELMADLALSEVEKSYLQLKNQAGKVKKRPTVFTGLPWKGDWYVPGGRSFQAILFKDAGSDYIWKNNEDVSGTIMDIEVVIERALDADYWLNLNDYNTTAEVAELDTRYEHFKAFRTGGMFNNNARKNINGGNDYWESGVVRPDLVLKDLIKIFHPTLVQEHQFIYYKPLKQR